MKIATIQLWEVSNSDNSIISDGCSLHIDKTFRDEFVKDIYSSRINTETPESYERISGIETFIKVPENIWNIIDKEKNIRLSEVEFNNLMSLKQIIPA
jgi:hypothetical protein